MRRVAMLCLLLALACGYGEAFQITCSLGPCATYNAFPQVLQSLPPLATAEMVATIPTSAGDLTLQAGVRSYYQMTNRRWSNVLDRTVSGTIDQVGVSHAQAGDSSATSFTLAGRQNGADLEVTITYDITATVQSPDFTSSYTFVNTRLLLVPRPSIQFLLNSRRDPGAPAPLYNLSRAEAGVTCTVEHEGASRTYDLSDAGDWTTHASNGFVTAGKIVVETTTSGYAAAHERRWCPILPTTATAVAPSGSTWEYKHGYAQTDTFPAMNTLDLMECRDGTQVRALDGGCLQAYNTYGGSAVWFASDGSRWLAASRACRTWNVTKRRWELHFYDLEIGCASTSGKRCVSVARPGYSPSAVRLEPSDNVMVAYVDELGNILVNFLDPSTPAPYALRGNPVDTGLDGIATGGMSMDLSGLVHLVYVDVSGNQHTASSDTSGASWTP
ncbi:MAG: hypothetical protein ABFE07_15090 [Armatimonadia bacterium]